MEVLDGFTVNPASPPASIHNDQDNNPTLVIEKANSQISVSYDRLISGIVHEIVGNSPITSISYSPDGTTVLVGYYDHRVVLHDVTTGAVRHEFKYDCRVHVVSYSWDGCQVAVGLEKSGVMVYNADTYTLLHKIKRSKGISCIQYSPDSNRILIGGSDKKAAIYDAASGAVLRTFYMKSDVRTASFSPNGNQVAIVLVNKKVFVYNSASGMSIHSFSTEGKLSSIAYSPDGYRIACGGSDMTVFIYDAISLDILLKIKRGGFVSCIAYSPDGSQIVVAENDKAIIYESTTGYVLHEFTRGGSINAIAYSPDNTKLCICGFDCTICCYETKTRTVLREWSRDSRTLTISYSPNSKQIAVGGNDNKVIIYDALTDDVLHSLKYDNAVFSLAYSPDSRQLAVGGKDCKVHVYDTLSWTIIYSYESTGWIRCLAYSPDGEQLAIAGSAHEVVLCTPISGALIHSIYHFGGVLSVIFSLDNAQISIGTIDNKVIVYDRMTRIVLHQYTYQGGGDIAYSPDSSQMAFGVENKGVIVCDSSTGTTLHEIYCGDSVRCIAYSPNGEHIAVGTSAGMMHVYTTSDGAPFCSNILFHAAVLGISFLPCLNSSPLDDEAYILAMAVGKFSIIMRVNANTRSPVEYLLKNNNDKMILNNINVKTAPFWFDEMGKTLLTGAVEKDRSELVSGLVQYCNKFELLHNNLNGKSVNLLDYLQGRNDLRSLHDIIESNCFREYTSYVQLSNIVNVLHKLIEKKFVDSVVKVLNAGEEKAMPGFVYQKDGFQTSIQGDPNRQLWSHFLFMSFNSTRSSISEFSPKTSTSPNDFHLWYNYETNLDQRVDLKTLRVLLPDLGSFDVLRCLIDLQSLKPFDTMSLGTVINAQWRKWARRMFLVQFYIYLAWFACVTLLLDATHKPRKGHNVIAVERQWTEYLFTVLVMGGLVYFTYLEFLQWSIQDKSLYWRDGWNVCQHIARLLTVVFVILEYCNVSRELVAHFAAMAMLCNMSMILFFLRGFDRTAWIIHALICIMEDMIPFLIVMFVILLTFSLTFWVLYDPGAAINMCDIDTEDCDSRSFDKFGSSLQTTFYAGIFADFELDSLEETYSRVFSQILLAAMLTITSIISMNALIAFMGNTFAKVVEEKTAVLTRTKALFILEMYSQMGAAQRKQLEEENRWTYILVSNAVLDDSHDKTNAQQHNDVTMMKEIAELKAELSKTKAEIKADILSEFRLELNNAVKKIGTMLPKEDSM